MRIDLDKTSKKVMSELKIDIRELIKMVDKVIKEYYGLIEEEGALFIICKNNNIDCVEKS